MYDPMSSKRTAVELQEFHEDSLASRVSEAIAQIQSELGMRAPVLAEQVYEWMGRIAGGNPPASRLAHPDMFPFLLLPGWFAESVQAPFELPFHADLLYSSVNGYYHVRLVDDVMDRSHCAAPELLPAIGFFHARFQFAYQRYFHTTHPFWDAFFEHWVSSSEAALRDARSRVIDLEHFLRVSARKVCAAKIPLTAVCYKLGRPDLLAPWLQLCDTFGRCVQMWDDLADWSEDLASGNASYLISEGARCKRADETLVGWLLREGIAWGTELLQTWIEQLASEAQQLGSAGLVRFVDSRRARIQKWKADNVQAVRACRRLAAAFDR